MSDVNLYNSGLQLVSSNGALPAREGSAVVNRPEGRAEEQRTIQDAESSQRSGSAQARESLAAVGSGSITESYHGSLKSAITQLNDFAQSVQRDLQFEVSNDTGQTIVRVVDRDTQEVIRQIPDDVALKLAENLQQDEPLTLFDAKV